MSTRTPTNCTLSLQRDGSTVEGMTGLAALVLPARPEVIALREIPAGKAFEIYFNGVVAVRESDRLVDDSTSASYRIVGVAHYNTPHASHTEVVAEQRLGNS